MRSAAAILTLLLLATGLTGCLGGGEDLNPNALPDGSGSSAGAGSGDSQDNGSDTSSGDDGAGSGDEAGEDSADGDANATDEDGPSIPTPPPVAKRPMAVIAHIDTGINPYHETFRDPSSLAFVHPSEYIEGIPEDVPALNLTLDASSYEAALEADADVWESVEQDQLYWIPGTRIVGAISMGSGGTYCPAVDAPPANILGHPLQDCEERPILDDHGHGTMTGSRAVSADVSLCPTCRLVTIEGLGSGSVAWAAEQGWIDVQTNSWVNFVPAPVNQHLPATGTTEAFADAAQRMVTIAATGNGAAYSQGFVPFPSYGLSTAAPGVILVGGHDNGYVAPWSDSPPHVVADGFRGLAAHSDSLTEISAHGFSCCTSASAPYAAGAAGHLIQEARTILGNTSAGLSPDGVIATGPANQALSGPLQDGEFTLDELRELLFKTAQPRPTATPHDGDAHWGSAESTPNPTDPAGNKYCVGCWSTPIAYEDVPAEVPLVAYLGYGGISVHSDQAGSRVLAGHEAMPERPTADAFYEQDQALRDVLYGSAT